MDGLSCGCCNKSFTSAHALERHRLRCRLRPRSRKKACSECSRSKVRCDQAFPACSRCVVHALPCEYPPNVARPPTTDATTGAGARADMEVLSQQPTAPSPSLSVSRQFSLPLTALSWASVGQPQHHEPQHQPQTHITESTAPFSAHAWIQESDPSWRYDTIPVSMTDDGQRDSSPSSLDTWAVSSASTLVEQQQQQQQQQKAATDAFQKLSIYISSRWASAEQGLDFMDRLLKEQIHGFATGMRRPYFIHHEHWTSPGRPLALVEATVVAQLYLTRTPQSDPLLLRSIDAQLTQIQRSLASHDRADDLATLQAAILYAGMRMYRAGSTAAELIGRVPNRLMQHVLSKNLDYLTLISNPTPEDWKTWILHESLRRCFFTTHALDYVSHTRQSQANVLCAFYADGPLPCPRDVWEAPNAEVWAARYRAWQEHGGWVPGSGCAPGSASSDAAAATAAAAAVPPLQPRDMFCWVHGRTTGREDKLLAWFQTAEEDLARLVFECSRAQAWTEAAEGMMMGGSLGLGV